MQRSVSARWCRHLINERKDHIRDRRVWKEVQAEWDSTLAQKGFRDLERGKTGFRRPPFARLSQAGQPRFALSNAGPLVKREGILSQSKIYVAREARPSFADYLNVTRTISRVEGFVCRLALEVDTLSELLRQAQAVDPALTRYKVKLILARRFKLYRRWLEPDDEQTPYVQRLDPVTRYGRALDYVYAKVSLAGLFKTMNEYNSDKISLKFRHALTFDSLERKKMLLQIDWCGNAASYLRRVIDRRLRRRNSFRKERR